MVFFVLLLQGLPLLLCFHLGDSLRRLFVSLLPACAVHADRRLSVSILALLFPLRRFLLRLVFGGLALPSFRLRRWLASFRRAVSAPCPVASSFPAWRYVAVWRGCGNLPRGVWGWLRSIRLRFAPARLGPGRGFFGLSAVLPSAAVPVRL